MGMFKEWVERKEARLHENDDFDVSGLVQGASDIASGIADAANQMAPAVREMIDQAMTLDLISGKPLGSTFFSWVYWPVRGTIGIGQGIGNSIMWLAKKIFGGKKPDDEGIAQFYENLPEDAKQRVNQAAQEHMRKQMRTV